jgi:hypothetical protein
MCLDKMIQLWKNVLLSPKKTFKKEKKKSNLGLGAKYILIAGAITGIIVGIVSLNPIILLTSIILYPLINLLSWLIGSGINFVFARILGGKGDYMKQSYLIALYSAPLSIISTIIFIIPTVGIWLSFLIAIYGFYLLTFALKEAHSYSTGRAIMTWLLPFIIVVAIVASMTALFFAYYVSAYGSMIPDISQVLV